MPRPERPIDPSGGPAQRFAADLRKLREQAGNPTYRDMAKSAYFSKATLSAAASGHRLPSWEVTAAYVAACGGDVEQWHASYRAVRKELNLAEDDRSPRMTPQPRDVQAAIRTRLPTIRRITIPVAAAVVLAAVLIVVVRSVGTNKPTASTVPTRGPLAATSAPARFAGAREPVADNADPKQSRCAYDVGVTTLDSVEVNTATENFLGVAELRHSPGCHVAWGRFTPSDRMTFMHSATVTITARRPATHTTGMPYTTRFDGQAVFSNILLEQHGCIEITVTVTAPSGGGSATTACMR